MGSARHRRRLAAVILGRRARRAGRAPRIRLGGTAVVVGRYGTADLLVRAADGGYLPVLVKGHRTAGPRGWGGVFALAPTRCGGAAARPADAGPPRGRAGAGPPDPAAGRPRAVVVRPPRRNHRQGRPGDGSGVGRRGHDRLACAGSPAGSRTTGERGRAPPRADLSLLEEYDVRFADRVSGRHGGGHRGPAQAQPSRVSECRRCPWWPRCSAELEAAHDVSLVVAGGDVDVLHAAGVQTYDDLAGLDAGVAAALPLTAIAPGEARVRAIAVRDGLPLVRRTARCSRVVRTSSWTSTWSPTLMTAHTCGARSFRAAAARVRDRVPPFVTWRRCPIRRPGRISWSSGGICRRADGRRRLRRSASPPTATPAWPRSAGCTACRSGSRRCRECRTSRDRGVLPLAAMGGRVRRGPAVVRGARIASTQVGGRGSRLLVAGPGAQRRELHGVVPDGGVRLGRRCRAGVARAAAAATTRTTSAPPWSCGAG